ncbi:hypothetical protein ACJMK2_009189 [Sinanodonta woodiana]|uniref:Uncharacterized protein n=1 Tax=Sinanodonta woodiana TaxID=1069815 RepID=A0ABD3VEK1_SINWO
MVTSITYLQSISATEDRKNTTEDPPATENSENVYRYTDGVKNRTDIVRSGIVNGTSPLASGFASTTEKEQEQEKEEGVREEEEDEKKANSFVRPILKRKLFNNYNGGNLHERIWSPRKRQLRVRFQGLGNYESVENVSDFKGLQHSKARLNFPVNLEKSKIHNNLDDITSLCLWKSVLAEFLGTLILVFVGCGSWIQRWTGDILMTIQIKDDTVQSTSNVFSTDIIQIALVFGVSVATIVWIIGHISGGHINPAVTCSMLVTRRISLARAFLFIVAQLFGSVVGAGILMGVTPKEKNGTLGCTFLGQGVSCLMGVIVELIITCVLVLTVHTSCDKHRKDLSGSFPLTIGLSVTMCHLFAVKFTGSSMNTARSFGPVVFMGIWQDHWVYWVGPNLGGILAGLLYEKLFQTNASLEMCGDFFFSSKNDNDNLAENKYIMGQIEEEDDEIE